QAGYPTNLRELNDWYVRTPATGKVATDYTNALGLTRFTTYDSNKGKAIDDIKVPPRGQPFPPEDQVELASMIASNAPALQLLLAIEPTTNGRYPIDLTQGVTTLLPHLSKIRGGVQLLTYNALLDAEKGQPEEATRSLQAGLRLGNSLSEEPIVISQLVRI